jgi:hypothetical protein
MPGLLKSLIIVITERREVFIVILSPQEQLRVGFIMYVAIWNMTTLFNFGRKLNMLVVSFGHCCEKRTNLHMTATQNMKLVISVSHC